MESLYNQHEKSANSPASVENKKRELLVILMLSLSAGFSEPLYSQSSNHIENYGKALSTKEFGRVLEDRLDEVKEVLTDEHEIAFSAIIPDGDSLTNDTVLIKRDRVAYNRPDYNRVIENLDKYRGSPKMYQALGGEQKIYEYIIILEREMLDTLTKAPTGTREELYDDKMILLANKANNPDKTVDIVMSTSLEKKKLERNRAFMASMKSSNTKIKEKQGKYLDKTLSNEFFK